MGRRMDISLFSCPAALGGQIHIRFQTVRGADKKTMTSEERREARYRRRKAARLAKREEKVKNALSFDTVMTFIRLYRSAVRCFRGVRWKASVQAYRSRCGINVAKRLKEMRDGIFRLRKSPEFTTRERGHERRINSIYIDDRVPQKCLCYYSLKPVLHRSLIYDNYASQEGKGTDKARRRIKCMLERHIRRYGMTGGIIIFDFKGFFDSIRHGLVRHVLMRNYTDRRIVGANMKIVRQAKKFIGLVLGSENSQDFAISTPNSFDHYIKEVLRVEAFGRYMDDGMIIDRDFDRLKLVWQKIREFAGTLGFTLNEKKSRIIRFGKPFTILKRKYGFSKTGGIIVRPGRESLIRERRKLKRLYSRFLEGTMPLKAGMESINAWKASLRGTRSWKIKKEMDRLYNRLYISTWVHGLEVRKECTGKLYQEGRSLMPQKTA